MHKGILPGCEPLGQAFNKWMQWQRLGVELSAQFKATRSVVHLGLDGEQHRLGPSREDHKIRGVLTGGHPVEPLGSGPMADSEMPYSVKNSTEQSPAVAATCTSGDRAAR